MTKVTAVDLITILFAKYLTQASSRIPGRVQQPSRSTLMPRDTYTRPSQQFDPKYNQGVPANTPYTPRRIIPGRK
ncbi:hypothetical protein HN587_01820 [Candidatus Woesearchaeota archaeon]|jgi:hypothetical protein|nr:hypothetical protein [Candidatus Woesearchaeota archaeon]